MRRTTRQAKTDIPPMKKKSASALAVFNPRGLTAHRKQSATRSCRMPALSGVLLCAAGLLAIPGKAFSQGQGMNRPGAVMCLRPLVGSVSAIVVAILLYASNHAGAQSQAPPMIGIMYLENADSLGDPIHDWSSDPALTNPYAQGISLRTHWDRVEPHEHADPNDFYWDYLDQGVALA